MFLLGVAGAGAANAQASARVQAKAQVVRAEVSERVVAAGRSLARAQQGGSRQRVEVGLATIMIGGLHRESLARVAGRRRVVSVQFLRN